MALADFWIVFALLSVFGKTTYYTLQKRLLDGSDSAFRLGYITSVYGWLLTAPPATYVLLTDAPAVRWTVFAVVAVLGAVEIGGLSMYLKALELSDMSIVSPVNYPTLLRSGEPSLVEEWGLSVVSSSNPSPFYSKAGRRLYASNSESLTLT